MKKTIAEEIYILTNKFYDEIEKKINTKERDECVEKIERYIILRQKLINQLPNKITGEDRQLLADTIEIQKKIDIIMSNLKLDIESDLKKLNKQKLIKKSYDNTYMQIDGKFIDKKR